MLWAEYSPIPQHHINLDICRVATSTVKSRRAMAMDVQLCILAGTGPNAFIRASEQWRRNEEMKKEGV